MALVLASTATRATYLNRCVHAQVGQTKQLTPHLKRMTIAAEELHGFPWHGPDQWFRLFLPREGQAQPVLPTSADDWWPQIVAMPEEIRPWVRNYTVRHLRPELGELDIDFVLHGDVGPASRWLCGPAPATGSGCWIRPRHTTRRPAPDGSCWSATRLPSWRSRRSSSACRPAPTRRCSSRCRRRPIEWGCRCPREYG